MKIQLISSKNGAPGSHRRRYQRSGFTMIEIAISLAVIAFALVAIIGILPTGMNVQRENREETIINQDANFLLNALRNGEQGINDLTNYVLAITNTVNRYNVNGAPQGGSTVFGYTYNGSTADPPFPITNGFRIIGLLSTPKYVPVIIGPPANRTYDGFFSNHVVATVLALSGPASDKYPQTNASVRDLALTYRLILDVVPFQPFDPWLGTPPLVANTNEFLAWSNYWAVAGNVKTNLHEVRLTYRWPLFSGGRLGNGRQVYRTLAGGELWSTNEPGFGDNNTGPFPHRTFFFQPRTYVKAP